jgi:hypothetical protein
MKGRAADPVRTKYQIEKNRAKVIIEMIGRRV